MRPQDKLFVVIGSSIVLIGASYAGFTLFATKDSDRTKVPTTSMSDAASNSSLPTTSQQSSNASSVNTNYKDGTYQARASYDVPHGDTNSVTASLTVVGGVVTAATTTHDYRSRDSAAYIDYFDQEIKPAVIGKNLKGLSVSRVGGASLTSSAFDDVLDTVRNDAAV